MKFNKQEATNVLYGLTRETNVADADRGLLLVGAISKGLAYSLPLPSSPVVSLHSYYADNAEALVLSVLSDLNESVVFNLRQAKEMTFQIYRARYHVVHVPNAVDLHRLVDAVVNADDKRSLAPEFKGIFERICDIDKGGASQVAWCLTDMLSAKMNAEFDQEGRPIEQA